MHLLLLNNNPAVSRLIQRSAEKMGHHLDESDDYKQGFSNKYDCILVDNECYDEDGLKNVYQKNGGGCIIYVGPRGEPKPDVAHLLLEKPFLPTVFIALLEKAKQINAENGSAPQNAIKEEKIVVSAPAAASSVAPKEAPEHILSFDEPVSLSVEKEEEAMPVFKLKMEDDVYLADETELKTVDDPVETKLEVAQDDDSLPTFSLKMDEEELSFNPSVSEPLEEKTTSVLNKNDINELKLLLDELPLEDELKLETKEISIESSPEEDTKLTIETEETFDLHVDDEDEPFSLSMEEEENIAKPAVEEDSFGLNFADTSSEEKLTFADSELSLEDDQTSHDDLDVSLDLLETLDENDLKQAFGEEVTPPLAVAPSLDTTIHQEAEDFKTQIQETLQESLAGLTRREALREALKGMRVNISITFEEA